MHLPRAVPMLAVPAVLLMVPFAMLGFLGQLFMEWQGGFISNFPVTGWLQDVLGPSALEGLLLGCSFGAYRLYRSRNTKFTSDNDAGARAWVGRHPAATGFALLFLVAFTVWRLWWIFFSGLYIGDFAAIAQKASDASELHVYRGLPAEHRSEYKAELQKPNVERHGFRFYAEARKLSELESREIRQILVSRYLFTAKPVFRMCGGFHPDFSIAWRDSSGDYEIQFCLGCGEIRSYGPNTRVDSAMHYSGKMVLEKFESDLFQSTAIKEPLSQ